MRFEGCGTAIVTPFQNDFSVDEAALRKLVRRQIEGGVHFLVPCGTTGENPTLTRAEHLRVVAITLEEAQGRVPVLAGAGGYNTTEVVELAREMEQLCNYGLEGNFAAARVIHRKYLPLMEINFVESNPIPVKAAMSLMGLLEPVWRLPLVAPKAESLQKIRAVLESLEILERVTVAAVSAAN